MEDNYVLCTPAGQLLNLDVVLVECEFIAQNLKEDTIPMLYLCPSVSNRKSKKMDKLAKAANKEEIERLVKDFQIAFLLPGGQSMTMQVGNNQSVESVMKGLCQIGLEEKNALLLHYSAYDFQIYRQNDIIEVKSSVIIGTIPYISQCRQNSTIPKLVLVQKYHDPYTAQV